MNDPIFSPFPSFSILTVLTKISIELKSEALLWKLLLARLCKQHNRDTPKSPQPKLHSQVLENDLNGWSHENSHGKGFTYILTSMKDSFGMV